ncbi:DUF4407 domain-containing protein [Fulvivirga lutea]|uniref:DUF4407 domain-containing protein n=1 Tax=Fulvivirga lutea TaxID=2810512 RepID=A0A974ZZB9_9BACT|nr:DUF4407 domain-containing protein [Fulvivirga lutea]QSE95916.1 DUF4407 domain-containing protein [Fulvivirga lutea]
MKKVKNFFWYCAGANHQLLEKCPTDESKYVGIGATIFFTGLFAVLAAGYGLYTVFDSYLIASTLGLVWGLMIFNLDRFIVSSMRKTTLGNELIMAIPRFVLAILISIVIAKPLELKIFEKEINGELTVMQDEMKSAKEATINTKYEEQKQLLTTDINRLKADITTKTAQRDELSRIAQQEADGTGGTKKRNPGPIYQIKKDDADRVNKELEELLAINQPLIIEKEKQISGIDSLQQSELLALETTDIGGPAARLEALNRISAQSAAIWWANAFIILLFIVIEISPILVKLLSSKGPYDYLLQKEEYQFEANAYKDKGFIHDGIKKETEALANKEKEFVRSNLDMKLDNA